MKPHIANPTPTWTQCLPDGLLPSIAILTLGLLFIIPAALSASQLEQGDDYQCDADGIVIPPWETVQFGWNINYMFSITLAWGDFSLSTAKLIDVIWDLCVGRGGQLALSYLVFGTLRRSVLVSLRRSPWHIPVLTRQLLDPVSVPGLWAAVQDMFAQQSLYRPEEQQEGETWRRLLGSQFGRPAKPRQAGSRRLCGFIPLVAYILGFATIVSAMTGYRAKMEPAYLQENGVTMPLNNNSEQVYPLYIQDWIDYSLCGQIDQDRPSVSLWPDNGCAHAWRQCESALISCSIHDTNSPVPRSKNITGLQEPNGTRASSHENS
jgi:hypothetical protein